MSERKHAFAQFVFGDENGANGVAISMVAFFSPLSLVAVGVMAFNDAWLRVHYPNFFTGKLSDFAVLFFFPLMVCATLSVLEFVRDLVLRRDQRICVEPSDFKLKLSCLFTAVVFTLLQFSPEFVAFYTRVLAVLDWTNHFSSYHYTMDPTDLMTLPMLFLAYRYGQARRREFPLTPE